MRHSNITNVNMMAVPLGEEDPSRPNNTRYKGLLLDLDPADRYRQPKQTTEPASAATKPLEADLEMD
jgi:hypothetical protein